MERELFSHQTDVMKNTRKINGRRRVVPGPKTISVRQKKYFSVRNVRATVALENPNAEH